MRENDGRPRRSSNKLRALLVAAVAALASAAFASTAGASAPGSPFTAEFNYVGVDVSTQMGGISELVDIQEPLELDGTYRDADGNFSLPTDGGLEFPDIALDIEGVPLTGEIGLVEPAAGNYDDATGAMTLKPKIYLELGIADVGALPIPGLGSGPLACRFAPLEVNLSTANGWPAEASPFANPATVENGSISGAWQTKPAVQPVTGSATMCNLIASMLDPVGGLWLANSTEEITEMPAATAPKPPEIVPAKACAEDPTQEKCQTPPPPPASCENTPSLCKGQVGFAMAALKAVNVKKGKKATVRVTVSNSGKGAANGVQVCASVPAKAKKAVKVPACRAIGSLQPGASSSAAFVLKTTSKAKGSLKVTFKLTSADAGSAQASATLKVKAGKKKGKKKK